MTQNLEIFQACLKNALLTKNSRHGVYNLKNDFITVFPKFGGEPLL